MKIIFASNNKGKIGEINSLFKNLPFTIFPQGDLNVPDIEETGQTFIENAILKARHACDVTGLPALADDSGLVVPALQGEPGIYSARYAGLPSDSKKNIAKVLQAMEGKKNEERNAYFYCVLAFMMSAKDPMPLICQGIWHGTLTEKHVGVDGFGYDPIFYIPEENKTAAELTLERKNLLSHRGKALRDLVTQLPEKVNAYVCTTS